MTILGTRPEIIRLSRTMALLDKYVNHIIVHTGQNYDYELNEIFWNELELRKPDHFLDVDTTTLGTAVGDIIRKSEGLPHRRIYLTGSPMKEVLNYYRPKIDQSDILTRLNLCSSPTPPTNHQSPIIDHQLLATNHYFLVSVHREENVDNPENLTKILTILNRLAKQYKLPVIVSTHPRTRKKLELPHAAPLVPHTLIQFLKPFGFPDYVHLQQHALCTLSDSGTISEESAILSFPAITLRNSMERPEAQDTGTIILSELDSDTVLQSVRLAIEEHKNKKHSSIPPEYQVTDTSLRVVKLIIGNTRLSNLWNGIMSQNQ